MNVPWTRSSYIADDHGFRKPATNTNLHEAMAYGFVADYNVAANRSTWHKKSWNMLQGYEQMISVEYFTCFSSA